MKVHVRVKCSAESSTQNDVDKGLLIKFECTLGTIQNLEATHSTAHVF